MPFETNQLFPYILLRQMTVPLQVSHNLSRLQSKAEERLKQKWYEVTANQVL